MLLPKHRSNEEMRKRYALLNLSHDELKQYLPQGKNSVSNCLERFGGIGICLYPSTLHLTSEPP